VEFRSAAAPVAVCTYCRSTVVREGDSLRKIGQSAELFDDHTPLQLGASGVYQQRAFTIVGRLQHGYGADIDNAAAGTKPKIEGSWNEWYVVFNDGKGGWLSEDNDQYVVAQDVDPDRPPPAVSEIQLEQKVFLFDTAWRVASLVRSRLLAAQGELPSPPPLEQVYTIADLRNADGLVATLDYAVADHPKLAIGRSARLSDLQLQGLKLEFNAETKTLGGRSFDCPSCGAPVEIKLADTRSLTCGACRAVIDVSSGIGAELRAVKQQKYMRPKIPVGQTGRLAIGGKRLQDWQVVGFAQKRSKPSESVDPFRWGEYLLYNRHEGFAFLIDSSDGWVVYRTLTGTPKMITAGDMAMEWDGIRYRRTDTYTAIVVYVEGEFYWQVDQRQTAKVADYVGSGAKIGAMLSRETSKTEVIWSYGERLTAKAIVDGFALTAAQQQRVPIDVAPIGRDRTQFYQYVLVGLFFIIILMIAVSNDDDDGYYGTHGGAFGGYSSAGGHK